MRIIPHELYKYAPNLALMALRKELAMYDYVLFHQRNNIAMQPYLDLGYEYFNLVVVLWVKEMLSRNNYVNSFYRFYAQYQKTIWIPTSIFLIIECCVQWDIKAFVSHTNESWFLIADRFVQQAVMKLNWSLEIYQDLVKWYQMKFMQFNKTGRLKPVKLHMLQVISYFQTKLL